LLFFFFFFQAEDGIRDRNVTGVQTCALPISSMENFAEIASRFVSAGAAIQVESPEDVGVAWIELFRNPVRMREMSERARSLVESSRGATGRAFAKIALHLNGATR